jgi:ubiquinone biosynthesis protein UbiJ
MLAQAVLGETLALALTRLLALDPEHSRLLSPLAGKVIAVELNPFGRMVFSFTPHRVLVLPTAFAGPIDLSLRGNFMAFLRLLASSHPESELFKGELEVIGDVRVAGRLRVLLKRLNLDWEAELKERLGERLAREISTSIRAAAAWTKQARLTFQWNLAEFLQEETRALPAPLEAEDLYRRIDQLRDDVERLQVRIDRLKKFL